MVMCDYQMCNAMQYKKKVSNEPTHYDVGIIFKLFIVNITFERERVRYGIYRGFI